MKSMIEQSYALGEAVSVSLIVELLKAMYAKTRTRESVSVDMSDASSAEKNQSVLINKFFHLVKSHSSECCIRMRGGMEDVGLGARVVWISFQFWFVLCHVESI